MIVLRNQNLGEVDISMKEVQPGRVADRDQRLKETDKILATNYTPLDQSISHQNQQLQQTTGSLYLLVARKTDHIRSSTSIGLSVTTLPETVTWGHIEDIKLINDGTALGFGVLGGKSSGLIMRTIFPGELAEEIEDSRQGTS